MKIELGTIVKDKISGFTGVVENRATYLYGCDRYLVQPQVGEDGKYPESQMFDEPQLEVVGDQLMKPMPEPKQIHELGSTVYDPASDVEAMVMGRAVYLNGCARLLLEAKVVKNKRLDPWWVHELQVNAVKKEVKKQRPYESGGPNPYSSKY